MSARVVAVVPARGGSKSIPRKNLAATAGKPLLVWTLEVAHGCPIVDRVVLSTEDEEIARVGLAHGAEVPFRRPAELAGDDTPGMAVVEHALLWLQERERYRPDYVLSLQPTSPLRTRKDVEEAFAISQREEADAVVSVTRVREHPAWMKTVDAKGRLADAFELPVPSTRQELPAFHVLNGAIYLATVDVVLSRKTWYTDRTYAYVMPPERSIDIDTMWDLRVAEMILRERNAG